LANEQVITQKKEAMMWAYPFLIGYTLLAFVPLVMLRRSQPLSNRSLRLFCIVLTELFVIGGFLLMVAGFTLMFL
jgi:hypothetical protein